MPHLTLEYTANLPTFGAAEALWALNRALAATGEFEEIDIKSRAVRLDPFLVGTSSRGRALVHVKLAILTGRSAETRRELSKVLLATLQTTCEWPRGIHVQLCAEVEEIQRDCYAKASVGP